MHVNDGTMSWTKAGISHLSSRDVHGVSLRISAAVSTQCRLAPMCEQVSANPAMQVQCATSTVPLVRMITHGLRRDLLAT